MSLPNSIIDSGIPLIPTPKLSSSDRIYTKFNLEIAYPCTYLQEVRLYKDANIELIRKAMNRLN